jgi:hypothetical protein
MGCLFKRRTKDKIHNESEILSIKQNVNKPSLDLSASELKKKGVSINQSTFIGEKKYNDFLKEYEILEFIGKGKKI